MGLCHAWRARLLLYAEAVFFDHRIGQHFTSDLVHLGFGGCLIQAGIKRQNEVFALPDGRYAGQGKTAQGVCNGLALGVQDGGFQRNVDMRLHLLDYSGRGRSARGQ